MSHDLVLQGGGERRSPPFVLWLVSKVLDMLEVMTLWRPVNLLHTVQFKQDTDKHLVV